MQQIKTEGENIDTNPLVGSSVFWQHISLCVRSLEKHAVMHFVDRMVDVGMCVWAYHAPN